MKTQIRPSTGIITVVINTPQGRRTVSTGCTSPVEAKQVIKSANIAGIEVLAKANALSQATPPILSTIANGSVLATTITNAASQLHQLLSQGTPTANDITSVLQASESAFEDLVARELVRLTAAIPPGELAIQWDMAYEVQDIERVLAWTPEGAWERFAGPVARLTPQIPEDVMVGYHLCYGTFPEWPMYEARDYEVLVRMANYAVANSGRTVDWVHMAGPRYLRSEDKRFFRPLSDLDVGDTRVYLGIVLPVDGLPGLRRRHATASRYLSDFGVAMYCGFGRQPGADGMETMREHAAVVRALREAVS